MPNPTYVRLDDNGLLYLLTLLEPVIEAAGEDNVIEIIQKNGVALTVQNKTVNIEVPTDSDINGLISTALANGSNPYTTESDVQQLIDYELADITGIDFEIVSTLPASGVKGVIYLVGSTTPYDEYIWVEPTGGTAHFEQIGSTSIDFEIVSTLPASGVKGVIYLVGDTTPYDEYIWIEPTGGTAHFEQIGSTSIDLSGYVQASEMHALTNAEIDTIFQQVFGS